MIRSLIAVSFLTYAAVDPTLPEDPVIALQLGDVLCVAFEPSSKTCLVKITVSQKTDEGTVLVEEMQLNDPQRRSTPITPKRVAADHCHGRGSKSVCRCWILCRAPAMRTRVHCPRLFRRQAFRGRGHAIHVVSRRRSDGQNSDAAPNII